MLHSVVMDKCHGHESDSSSDDSSYDFSSPDSSSDDFSCDSSPDSSSSHSDEELFIEIIDQIRQRIDQNDTSAGFSQKDRLFQSSTFYLIYRIASQLFSNGYIADNGQNGSVVISSRDRSWSEVIEYKIPDFLDVPNQLIKQQFHLDERSSCPTILLAEFDQNSNIQLSPYQGDHHDAINVIYGVRCRICDPQSDGSRDVKYVGQTTQTLHDRVCNQHAGSVPKYTDKKLSKSAPNRPMYEHAAQHFKKKHLPRDSTPRDAFSLTMDVILLPVTDDSDLRSWECFWQFFLNARTNVIGSWSQR